MTETEKEFEGTITFNNLSGWLKTVVVFGWIAFSLYIITFLIGFGVGVMEL